MRNLLLTMLLAGTAISPAFAERPGRDDFSGPREDRHVERSESHQDRSESRQERSESRSVRSQQVERHAERASLNGNGQSAGDSTPAQVDVHRAQVQERIRDRSSDQAEVSAAEIEARRAQVRERVRDRSGDADAAQSNVNERGRPVLQPNGAGNNNDSVANGRNRDHRDARDVGQPNVGGRTDRGHVRVRPPEGARPDRPAPLPETARRHDRHGDHHWRTDWRNNHHYDWRNHRRHHRSIFHLGFYFDPFGWNYHRYGIGWRMWPSYYSSNYWLNDPYQYRLPYAPFPYRWVRYYNDALLVDTYTGQVVDVIYDFFW